MFTHHFRHYLLNMTSSYVLYLLNSLGSIRMKIKSFTMLTQQITSIHSTYKLTTTFIIYCVYCCHRIRHLLLLHEDKFIYYVYTTDITYKLTTTFIIFYVYYCHLIRHLLLLQLCRPTLASQLILIHTLDIIDCTKTQYSHMHIPY